jgi:hypothetical protein
MKTIAARDYNDIAKYIGKTTTSNSLAIVGPVILFSDDTWCLPIITQDNLGHRQETVRLGTRCLAPSDYPVFDYADTIIMITRLGDLTLQEAEENRRHLIRELGQRFERVQSCIDELEFGRAVAIAFPSEESLRLRRQVESEYNTATG